LQKKTFVILCRITPAYLYHNLTETVTASHFIYQNN